MRRIGDFLFKTTTVVTFTTACGGVPANKTSKSSSIIAQNSMKLIDTNSDLNEKLKADLPGIGKMTGGCTAFHLGHGIVATAGHCLTIHTPSLEDYSCHSLDIAWGQTADTQVNLHSRCMKVLQYQLDDKADYALLLVDPAPAASIEIQADARVQKFAEQAIVIGFPKDKTLSFSDPCGTSWQDTESDNRIFHHRCDTLPGNSGSPVLDADTARVIGIHNGDADNQENYASFLPAAAEMIKLAESIDEPEERPNQLQFGPFADRLNKTLANFSSKTSAAVSFDLNFDVEDGYDKVVVVDGQGRIMEFTGHQEKHFEKMVTPVSVVVITDYSGPSQSVQISSIQYQ